MIDNDLKRIEKSIERIRKDNLPYNEKIEVNISEKNVKIRKKWDIIRRIVAIVMTRLAAETYLEKKKIDKRNCQRSLIFLKKNTSLDRY